MSTVQAFNTMLRSFLEELADVFPEETQISVFLEGFDPLVALTPRAPLDMFIAAMAPHAGLAMAKDPALFDNLQFPGGINFKKLWSSADVSDATRDAIWQYINLLLLLCTTVQSMPAEMLQTIETVAQTCADKVQSGQLDFSSLGSMLMGGDLGQLGLAGPAAEGSGAANGSGQRRSPAPARQGPGGRRLARK